MSVRSVRLPGSSKSTPDNVAKWMALRRAGMTVTAIATRFQVSGPLVSVSLRKAAKAVELTAGKDKSG